MKLNYWKTGLIVGILIWFGSGLGQHLTACTGIFYGTSKMALAGNNEDWKSPFSRIWVFPAEGKKYGRINWGFSEGGFQGGMNDQGLFYDGFALSPAPSPCASKKEVYPGDLVIKAMEECRSVDEVITLFEKYDRQFLASAQLFFADRMGNSAIIEGDAIVRKQGDYQIVTNFRQSAVAPADIKDSRYLIAQSLMNSQNQVDVALFRRILAQTHQEGMYPTQYSNICDLKNGIIYFYAFHNYEQVVVLNLKEELAKGKQLIDLKSLFPALFCAESYQRHIKKEMDDRLAKEKIVPVSDETLNKLTGQYDITAGSLNGYSVSISLQSHHLYAETLFLEKAELYPLSDTEYVLIGLEETIKCKFTLNENSKPTHLTFTMYGEESVATKKQ